MEGHGRGRGGGGRGRGNSRDEREIGGVEGQRSGRGRGRGRSNGNVNGGRGRGNQQYQDQQQQQQQQQHQQPHISRQPPPVNPWVSGPSRGRGVPNSQPSNTTLAQAAVGSTSAVQKPVSSGSYASKLQLSSSSQQSRPNPVCAGAIGSKMQSLEISGQASQSSTGEGILPLRRPDTGGSARIRSVNILVNHFPVSFNPNAVIGHYDIDVKPEENSAKGRPVKISKANLSLIVDKLFCDNPSFKFEMTGYDCEKNVFSAIPLPTGSFPVVFSNDEDMRCRSYTVTINLVKELRLNKLKDYLTGSLLQIPRDVLQAMDVVMKENPRRCMVSIGKTFHAKDSDNNLKRENDLECGLLASEGFQHGLKSTSQGLALCLDYSVLAVRKRIPVIDFLGEHLYGFTLRDFQNKMKRRDIECVLRGLKVHVIHRVTKQKYLVSGITDQRTCDISFTMEDPDGQEPPKSVRLIDYFRDKYGVNIQHGDIPCLNVGKGGRANYVPMELCVLVEGQRYPKEDLDDKAALLLRKISLVPPQDRKDTICGMLQAENGPCGGGICNNFGMEVQMNMTKVEGRVLKPPQLKLRTLDGNVNAVTVQRETCQWNLADNSVVEGRSLERWAVLDFSGWLNESFIQKLIARCNKLGLRMGKPLRIVKSRMQALSSADAVTSAMERIINETCRGQENLQLLLCVLTRKDSGYKNIKWVSEIKMGIITQCCLLKNTNEAKDQYLANLGMKINAKLGGSNVELMNRLPICEGEGHVMFIGADVNHPRAHDGSSPSIAAVVATMNWPGANKYSPRVRFQQHRSEKIISFGEICMELIEAYESSNGVKPKRILIFRDGVSEGQFDMVLNEELDDLKKVLQGRNYRPTITLIVAKKRHHTRLFPMGQRDASLKGGNIPPGTVVDKTIIHPFEFDFYLCSHYGSIGTSKPTHYYVLYDEHRFSSDKLQELIYNLCFTFARCCKPVSLVPPVYYADLLAYRGRLHLDAVTENQSSRRSSSFLGTSSSSTSNDESLFKLHSDLDNTMFFI